MKIKLNSKDFFTDCRDIFELKCRVHGNCKCLVSIINGFQTSDNTALKEGDEVFFIDKHTLPKEDELEAMLCARHTPEIHGKIKAARVAVAGLGGLGSNIAVMLARTGVGTLHLIDFDTVDASNLNRQHYFISHLGMSKTEAVKKQIAQINPFVKVICDNVRIEEKNCADIFADDNIICEAFDNPESKALLVNTMLEKNSYVIASSGMAGCGKSNEIITRRISEKFYLCGDGTSEAKQGCGLMAPRALICASHQANAVLRIILEKFDV